MYPQILLVLGVGLVIVHCADKPTWPDTYYVEGYLQLPYAEINEPFIAYFDNTVDKSRIDYYSGTVVTIQIGEDAKTKPYGTTYKVAPVSNNTVQSRMCFQVDGTNDSSVASQPVLPDLTKYMLANKTEVGNKTITTWIYQQKLYNKVNTYTMVVDLTEKKKPIPIRFEMMGYDTLFGSHYDKYYLLYENYTESKPFSNATFEPTPADCGPMPGAGDSEDRILMNPMQEYIHGESSHVDDMFNKYKKIHKKGYPGDREHERRKDIFRQNVRFIHSTNRAGLSYTLAINHLADMQDSEVALMRGRLRSRGDRGGRTFNPGMYDSAHVPDILDWRLYGAVTPVKDQAVCGSCWSFGATGTIEGALFLKTKELKRLSQQELMDCSWGQLNNGCDGGEDVRAYDFIQKYGLQTEYDYGPYLAQDSTCRVDNGAKSAVTLKDYVWVNPQNSTLDTPNMLANLKLAIAWHGPISIGIDASRKGFSFYSNGVYYDPECGNTENDLDHAVLAVGYGVMNGEPYWLVKNSWSTYWGNDGYVLMAQRNNNCGPATAPNFVILE